MKFDLLPQDCVSYILSCTSPRDACRSSTVSSEVRDAADSNLMWEKFLPSDYPEIISRLVSPVEFKSKKELFLKLSTPLLIDGGKKIFSIDKSTSKKCYMLSARELCIPWATNSLYWCWKSLLESRFVEVAELIMVCWLEIQGTINTKMLSPNTTYGAYLIVKFPDRAFGLETLPSEVFVEVGGHRSQGTIYLRCNGGIKTELGRDSVDTLGSRDIGGSVERVIEKREDGWLEIELGDFYNDGSEREVKMSLREVKGQHLKGGIVVEGIELRPKL
ncbi:hypothetical protein LguiB_006295 [Lonicera macranthoides]